MIVRFHARFSKDIDKLKEIQLRNALEELIILLENVSTLHEIPDVKKLKGATNAYRIKLGSYRVCFFYDKGVISLARVLQRKDVYKYFP
jgi:mRNA-degrading endonuclease RelE of RelBE toxin-antitoxin system